MSKRKLTRQQAWRIKIQGNGPGGPTSATPWSSSPWPAGRSARAARPRHRPLRHPGGSRVRPGQRVRCHLRANLEGLVTGDQVVWCAGEPPGSSSRRASATVCSAGQTLRQAQAVAANIDQIVVVIAPLPGTPRDALIDRYLVAAETVNIEPVILPNKTDLLAADPKLRQQLDELLAIYPTLGYRILHTSSKRGGLEELRGPAGERTSVFVGQSGVGKISLVNALLPDVVPSAGGRPVGEHQQRRLYHHHRPAVPPALRRQPIDSRASASSACGI